MEILDIFILCMYICIVFSMVHSHMRLRITLTARRTAHFMQAGVALTNAADRSIELEMQKEEERLEVRIKIIAEQAIILILSSSLAYSMLCIS